METRDVLLVDAFADEPMTGTPVGVVLDGSDLAPDQRDAVASELGAPGTAFVSETAEGWSLRVAGDTEFGRGAHVAIAAASALDERDLLADDAVAFDRGDRTVQVTVERDGTFWTDVDRPDLREAALDADAAAEALGVDVAAIRDVGADLPIVRASLGSGVLLVPVNFLEHLSGADPDPGAVADCLAATDAAALYGYTFDTLSGDAEIHGLLVTPDGPQARAGGEAAACAAVAARHYGAFDHDRMELRVEQGDLLDRPARIAVRTDGPTAADGDEQGGRLSVGGRAVTVLDGTVVIPPADEGGEIIEA